MLLFNGNLLISPQMSRLLFFSIKCLLKKSRIRESKNLSTDAESRTDTILERLRYIKNRQIYKLKSRLLERVGLRADSLKIDRVDQLVADPSQ